MRCLLDSHVHIEEFESVDSLKTKCNNSRIDAVICVGGDINSSKKALEVSELFPEFYYPAIGFHPANILELDLDQVQNFISDNIEKCVALGEVGLDYSYNFAKPKEIRAKMRESLKALLSIADSYDKPVSIHSRSAYNDSLNIMSDAGVEGVFHWYDGPIHILRQILDSGYFVSATPSLEYSKGARSVILETPIERILVETDSPVYLRSLGRKSTPVDVIRVVDAIAELKELEPKEVARVTTRNSERLFCL